MTDAEATSQQSEKAGQKRIDKLTLNNQVVSMRKDVKRSKLWLINNLNHRAKKLAGKKGSDCQKAKNARRVERLRNEIQILKHIDVDEVSKFALCSKLGPAEVVNELEKLEADQRAMLRLAHHKLVQTRVTAFRKDHPVPIDRLILLFRALGLKYQKKKLTKNENGGNIETAKPASKKSSKAAKTANKDLSKALSSATSDEELEEYSKEKEEEGVESSKVENEPEKTERKVSNTRSKERIREGELSKKTDLISALSLENSNENSFTDSQVVKSSKKNTQKPKERLKVQWPVGKQPTVDRKDGDCEIKRLNLEKLNADEIAFGSNNSTGSSSKISEVPRDSFFLGGVDPSSEEEEEPKEHYQKEKPRYYDRHIPKEEKPFKKGRTAAEKKADKYANNMPLGKPRKFGGSSERRDEVAPAASDAGASSRVKTEEEANLHPSWQAKRKQQVSLTTFQGKKIKFGDDD